MPLNKSKGQMYNWVSHVHSHLAGKCPHACTYCFVQRSQFGPGARYSGPLRLIQSEFMVNYGAGKIIFIEHMNDMFAERVPGGMIFSILNHCKAYPDNEYIFQTKNPGRAKSLIDSFPPHFMIGTTIETNRVVPGLSMAPAPMKRFMDMLSLRARWPAAKIFVTVEPILDFDPDVLALMLMNLKPEFVNIGADSKGCGLEEPAWEKVERFIYMLNAAGVPIKKKTNLGRLMKEK